MAHSQECVLAQQVQVFDSISLQKCWSEHPNAKLDVRLGASRASRQTQSEPRENARASPVETGPCLGDSLLSLNGAQQIATLLTSLSSPIKPIQNVHDGPRDQETSVDIQKRF